MEDNGENQLLNRCISSIASMGDSPTVVVDADDCSDPAVDSVAEQLQAKGWSVEVLPRDGSDPAQLVISAPPVPKETAPPAQSNLQEQEAADALREWTAFEQAQQAGRAYSSESSWTAGKTSIVLLVVLILVFAVVWGTYIGPRRKLDQLAEDTCDELDGSIMLIAVGTVSSAINQAERLGFSGPELADRMREKCPSIVRQLEDFANE